MTNLDLGVGDTKRDCWKETEFVGEEICVSDIGAAKYGAIGIQEMPLEVF